jgi:alpha-tubulin suppressor-like RCC1 family protein
MNLNARKGFAAAAILALAMIGLWITSRPALKVPADLRARFPTGPVSPQIVGGYRHAILLAGDGNLWVWGKADWHCLERFGTDPFPRKIPSDHAWRRVAAGFGCGFAIRDDGTLWGWGANWSGMLGDGTTVHRSRMTQISTNQDWIEISAGLNHAVGLRADGTAWSWGENSNGQLGSGNFISTNRAVAVLTPLRWKTIRCSSLATSGIARDGSLWMWGDCRTNSPVPVCINSETNWLKLSANDYHFAGLKSDGTVWLWGQNRSGLLASKIVISPEIPEQAPSVAPWISVVSGGAGQSVVKADGTLWEWNSRRAEFFQCVLPARKWIAFGGSFSSDFALSEEGELWNWGAALGTEPRRDRLRELIALIPRAFGASADWARPKPVYRAKPVLLPRHGMEGEGEEVSSKR